MEEGVRIRGNKRKEKERRFSYSYTTKIEKWGRVLNKNKNKYKNYNADEKKII